MRRAHFEQLQPNCPTCQAAGRTVRSLVIGNVVHALGDDILEGTLICSDQGCQREHPIVDGVAIVVPDLQSWAGHQLDAALRRQDLSSDMESLLGDAAGPGSAFDRERTALSAYGRAHWGDLDPCEPSGSDVGLSPLVAAAFELAGDSPRGVWLDLGCAVGRGTLETARRTGDLAVGIDLSFGMLRVAERVRGEGRVVFPLRRVGMVVDRKEYPIPDVPADDMSFWCCDVGTLPFADAVFDGALSLNVLDCVPSPLGHLVEVGRVLRAGATALVSTPYDWTPTATPVGQWLGGHSQRGTSHGSSAVELRRVLAEANSGLVIKTERDRVPWRVYVNERATMDYDVHLLHLERSATAR